MIKNFKQLMDLSIKKKSKKIAVAAADDIEELTVVANAEKLNLADFILIGDVKKMKELIENNKLNIKSEMIDEKNHKKAADLAVDLVINKDAGVIMKGMLQSSTFLRAILNKEKGLNIRKHITQISVIEKENDDALMLITDCAITVNPDLKGKKIIIENAVDFAHKLGIECPRVAVLASLEIINFEMQDTVDAAVLSKMVDRGQISGCIVDGPFALDNAVSQEAAEKKGINSPVAGKADIIVVPNLTVGNTLTKSITHIAKKTVAAATVGADVPIVFTSRTESLKGKLLSIALASYISE